MRCGRTTNTGCGERSGAHNALRASNIAVTYPAGAALPDDFSRADWNTAQQQLKLGSPGSLLRDSKCEVILIDLDGDGRDEILLFSLPFGPAPHSGGTGREAGACSVRSSTAAVRLSVSRLRRKI